MKTKHISLRVSEADYDAIQNAADAAGRTMSEHLRRSAISSEAVTVPELNRNVWQQLAPAVSNLNQLARAANRFILLMKKSGASPSQFVELMNRTCAHVLELREDIQKIRRTLYGASPLEAAADLLDDYRRAANFGRLKIETDRLDEIAQQLRTVARELNEEPPSKIDIETNDN